MKKVLLAAMASLALSTIASAQTQVTNRSQIANSQTFTWANHPSATNPFTFATGIPGLSVDVNATPFSGWYTPCQAGPCWAGGFVDGDDLLYGYGITQYTLTFNQYLSAFATQGWHDSANTSGDILIAAYNGATLVGSFSQFTGSGGAPNNNQAAVIGLQGVNFDRIVLTGRNEFAINQVTVSTNTNVVPEPSTYALLAAGLAAMAVVSRRRRA